MKIVELIIDEEDEFGGIDAISIVESPAIEENFVALNDQKEVKLQSIDDEKKILMGALLIPNKTIYRKDGKEEYYIYFSKETVKKASELFLMKGKQNNATLEHKFDIEGLTLVESWIVEDKQKDKTSLYNMDVPVGTWMGAVKVNNDEIWNDFVKNGSVKGFSIEGFFLDKEERPKEKIKDELNEVELETYNDYPDSAVNNAKKALKYKKENGSSCGTSVGWTRASQLANRENISRDTIARMASYKRHEANSGGSYEDGCGAIMYDAWGGKSGVNWAIKKLDQIDKEKLSQIEAGVKLLRIKKLLINASKKKNK
jgi:hypothetical protein